MYKFLRIGFRVVLGVVVVATAVLLYLFFLVDDRTYLRLAQEAIRDSSGLTLLVDGSFSLQRSLPPGISAERVRIVDDSDQAQVPSMAARRLNLRIALLPLLNRDIRLLMELEGPTISLGKTEKRRGRPKSDRSDSGWDLDIAEVTVRNGLIERAAGESRTEPLIAIHGLSLSHNRKAGTASISASGEFGESHYTVDATLVGQALDQPVQLDLDIAYGEERDQASESTAIRLKASGHFVPAGMQRLDLRFEGHLPDPTPLVRFAELEKGELRGLGPFDIDGRLRFDEDRLSLEDANLRWSDGGIKLEASMPIGGDPTLKADIDGTLPEMSRLLEATGIDAKILRELGALDAFGTVSYEDGVIQLEALRLSRSDGVLDLTISGSVADDTELELTLRSADGNRLGELIDAPDILAAPFPIEATAEIKSHNHRYSLPRFAISWEHAGALAELSGSMPALVELSQSPARLKLSAGTLAALPLRTELPEVGPIYARTDVYLTDGRLRLRDASVDLGRSDISGDIVVAFEEPPRVRAKLHSGFLDLDVLTGFREDDKEAQGAAETESSDDQPIASESILTQELDLSWSRILNGRLDVDVETLVSRTRTFRDLHLALRMENGLLHLPLIRLDRGSGHFSAGGRIDSRHSPARLEYHEDSYNVEIADWLELPEGIVEGGKSAASVALQTEGNTIAEMLAALNGQILLEMGPARIVEVGLSSLSEGVFSAVLRVASPTDDDQAFTDYQCGVFGVDIDDGVALMDRSLSLQSKRFVLAGKGRLDLRDGTINLQMRPRARKGLGFSAATLTGGFKISGQLDALDAGLSMGGLFGSYLATGVAAGLAATPAGTVATTSVIALRGIWDRIRASSFTCDSTLKRIERKRGTGASPRKWQTSTGPHPPADDNADGADDD